MKNTNMKRMAVFPVLMMLVVTALALIGSSFAWFTVANTASVSQITTSAQSDGVQLMLSQDANRYYTRNLKISTTAEGSVFTNTLYQVSTNGKLADGQTLLKFYNSQVSGYDVQNNQYVITKEDKTVVANAGILAAADMNGETNYGKAGLSYGESYEATTPTYIVFDLYMKVDRPAEIYLYDGTEAKAQKSSTDTAAADELLKALRVGFAYLGSTTTAENIKPETSLSGTASVIVWEPMATTVEGNKVITNGIISSTYVDGENDVEMRAYDNVTEKTETQTTLVDNELIVTDKTNTSGLTPLFSVNYADGCYSKVRVYVWLEGNDPDCTAAIAAKYLMLNLSFFAKEITA